MPTALPLIKGALQDLGVLASGEDPPTSESDEALLLLNELVETLGLDRGMLFTVLRTAKTLASGTASYTIGSGGSINIARPIWIDDAMLVYDTTASTPTEIPIDVLNDEEYAGWPQKTLQAPLSQAIYYDHGWSAGLGLIYPLPIPNVNTTQLVLYTPQDAVTSFADVNTTSYSLAKGVRRLLRKQLALELAPGYPAATVTPLLLKQAAESKAQFKSANVRPLLKRCDPALTGASGGHWNINSDAPNRGRR